MKKGSDSYTDSLQVRGLMWTDQWSLSASTLCGRLSSCRGFGNHTDNNLSSPKKYDMNIQTAGLLLPQTWLRYCYQGEYL